MAWQGSLPRNYHPSGTDLTGDDAAVTLDVSAARCVSKGGARRERKSSAEKNRGGKHEFPDREHCCFLSDQFVVFAGQVRRANNIVT